MKLRVVWVLAAVVTPVLAVSSVQAQDDSVLAWTVDSEGDHETWWLGGAEPLVREGVWLASQGELVRLVDLESTYRLCSCEGEPHGPCEPGSETARTRGLAFQRGGGEVQPVRHLMTQAELEDSRFGDYAHSSVVRGSVGPWVFVERSWGGYACGAAHGSSGVSLEVWNSETRHLRPSIETLVRPEELSGLLGGAEGQSAARILQVQADQAGSDSYEARPVALFPVWTGSLLGFELLWTGFAAYALGDGEWGSYSVSTRLPTSVTPASLQPWSKAPKVLSSFLREHPELVLGGWSLQPAALGERFATSKGVPSLAAPQGEVISQLDQPTDAVHDYFTAVQAGEPKSAFEHFALPGWDYAKWERVIWSGAGCAAVQSARLLQRDGSDASVQVDLCVEDRNAGAVDRWEGSMDVAFDSAEGRWEMSAWRLDKNGTCSPTCAP